MMIITRKIFMFLLFLISDDSLFIGTNESNTSTIVKFSFLGVLFFGFVILSIHQKKTFTKNHLSIHMTMILLIFISAALNNDILRFGYYYRAIYMFIAFLIILNYPLNLMLKDFIHVITFLSVFSLGTYLLEILKTSIFQYFPIVTNTSGYHYYNLFFSIVPVQNHGVPRNYGIFREPGVFIVFLLIALVLILFSKKKTSLTQVIILSLTVLTTRSSTGIIALITLFVFYFIFNRTQTKFNKLILLIIVTLASSYMVIYTDILFNPNGYGSFFGKFFNQHEVGSFKARYGSIILNANIFLKSPFWGVGLTNTENYFQALMLETFGIISDHNTNNILIQFSNYGLFFGIIWNSGYFFLAKKLFKNNIIQFIFLSILTIIFIGENMSNNLIITLLVYYGLVFKEKDKENGNESIMVN